MEKKNIDWGNLGFSYIQTDKRYVSNYKDGAWDEGTLTSDATVQISECAVCTDCIRRPEGLHDRRWSYRYFPPGPERSASGVLRQETGDPGIPAGSFH